jgi:hypothetical protein
MLSWYADYARQVEGKHGRKVRSVLIKPVLQLFAGEPNGRLFRTQIDTLMRNHQLGVGDVIHEASTVLSSALLDQRASDPVVSTDTRAGAGAGAGVEGRQFTSISAADHISN